MTRTFPTRTLLLGIFLLLEIAPVASAAGRCTGTASVCEQNIRAMMLGRKYLGVRFGDTRWGLTVKSIIEDSPAAKAGLRIGDRILTVNGIDCSKADMRRFKTVLGGVKAARVTIAVLRLGSVSWVTIELRPMSKEQIDRAVASHMRDAHAGVSLGEQR